MEETGVHEIQNPDQSWKVKALLIGGAIGALAGLGAAFLLTRRAEQQGQQLSITPAKGMKMGMLLAGLFRSILSLGDEK